MIGSGLIDIGSAARELARVSETSEGASSANSSALRFAASAGLYSETLTRLIAALAARDLSKGDADYAKGIVRESMLEYSTWNQARQMGKMGVAGRFTPVMMSFLQYSTQVTWKLYRELYNAFGRDEKTKAEARKFLTGHLTAVTAMAGVLGMPFATVGALALEKLVDALDDDEEPFDATAALRNTMGDMFGPAIGEMISRGIPRGGGYGIDLSQRVGEQNLLPFSQWLSDKREFKDASSEAALRSLGAPVSMVSSLFTGFEKMGNGDFLGGAAEMLPTSIKGPTKAYQMSDKGYVDTLGNKLPMTPKAGAFLAQLLGFSPAEKAEYSEARGDQRARDVVLKKRANVLRNRIVNAISEGKLDEARDHYREAQEFDKANPAFSVLPDIEKSVMRRKKLQAVAQATGSPIGTNPKDIAGRDLTRYANIEYRAR
jgi:tetratricopeptide (TPR) repeat protein